MGLLGFVGNGTPLVRAERITKKRVCVTRAVIEQSVKVGGQTVIDPPSAPAESRTYAIPDSETAFRRRPQKVLPADIRLKDVIKSLPPEVFEINMKKAWLRALVTALAVPLSLIAIHFSPWFLLPVSWFIAGTAFTGLFTLGHDAGHNSFSKSVLLNDIVGNITMSILIYPYEQWKLQHNIHHKNTNMIRNEEIRGAEVADNAWQPLRVEMFARDKFGNVLAMLLSVVYHAFFHFGSILHWVVYHFDPRKFTARQMPKVIGSWLSCFLFAALAFPTLLALGGPWTLVKYWMVPWLGFHFWMSTFTLVHHTAPHIQFKQKPEWNAAREQLSGTVHCDFPRWIEILTHDINVHLPHHISPKIPSYNLKAAHESIREKWGAYINEASFSWKLREEIVRNCQVYDNGEYISFEEATRRANIQGRITPRRLSC